MMTVVPRYCPIFLPALVGGVLCPACNYDFGAYKLAQCGNGVREAREECDGADFGGDDCIDYGHLGGSLSCQATCLVDVTGCIDTAGCGDGAIEAPDEICDDQNLDPGDGCDSLCQIEPGWSCTGEPSVCTTDCGDGVIDPAEGCDDGNTAADDGCSSSCQIEAGWTCSGQPSNCDDSCGNGVCAPQFGEDEMGCNQDCAWTTVSAGESHSCGVRVDGSAWCWGSNGRGAFGDGSTDSSAVPVRALVPARMMGIAAGSGFTCGWDADGLAWCWGQNDRGQLGHGAAGGEELLPVPVSDLVTVTHVSTGFAHACAVAAAQVWCWGVNDRGQLGDGTTTTGLEPVVIALTDPPPLPGAIQAAAGRDHSCASFDDGRTRCWGMNDVGQLGDSTTVSSLVPVSVPSGVVAGDSVGAGGMHSCRVGSLGAVTCWGGGMSGQLGDGGINDSSSPVGATGMGNASVVSAGELHTCAVEMGVAWCWGINVFGRLGDGTEAFRATAVEAPVPGGAATISAGFAHTCSVDVAGRAWCWGSNNQGQLGTGDAVDRLLVPSRVAVPAP